MSSNILTDINGKELPNRIVASRAITYDMEKVLEDFDQLGLEKTIENIQDRINAWIEEDFRQPIGKWEVLTMLQFNDGELEEYFPLELEE